MEDSVLPLMYDSAMAAQEVYRLLMQDDTISELLRTLKEDTLFIVDNFNTTASQDSTLSVEMKYRCRVLFTTRSRFDNYTSTEVEEIADKQVLLSLAGCFYSDAESHQDILEQIIDTVHSHTLAVELTARLLETGILEPMDLLEKLKTYYDHIHTLFSLYQLTGDEQDIMRSMAFVPTTVLHLFRKEYRCSV